jgi:hypothetical protein
MQLDSDVGHVVSQYLSVRGTALFQNFSCEACDFRINAEVRPGCK